MNTEKLPHEWSKESLLNKAQRYAETMLKQERDSWEFGFWSALTLELLARAVLAATSPALVADNRDWDNIYYALGHQPTTKKFKPKSADTTDILVRLQSVLPEFTREMLSFSITHVNRRNTELHSGALPFDGLGTSKWLSMFYATSRALLESIGEDLPLLFGAAEAEAAETLLQALEDQASKAVLGTIKAHRTVWEEKTEAERKKLQKQSETMASRHWGHRVACPSCSCTALLHGTTIGIPTQSLEQDMIVERQTMLPSKFECLACGLKVTGYSKLNSCDLGDTFTATFRYDAVDYFASDEDDESYQGLEEDYNEY